jgi:chromosome segregation ATPase
MSSKKEGAPGWLNELRGDYEREMDRANAANAELTRERDELREQFNQYVRGAETEANELRADLQGLMDESAASTEAMDRARAEIDSLRAYNEMLLKVEREHVAEIERLTQLLKDHDIEDVQPLPRS